MFKIKFIDIDRILAISCYIVTLFTIILLKLFIKQYIFLIYNIRIHMDLTDSMDFNAKEALN
jgi:hypothetical protein